MTSIVNSNSANNPFNSAISQLAYGFVPTVGNRLCVFASRDLTNVVDLPTPSWTRAYSSVHGVGRHTCFVKDVEVGEPTTIDIGFADGGAQNCSGVIEITDFEPNIQTMIQDFRAIPTNSADQTLDSFNINTQNGLLITGVSANNNSNITLDLPVGDILWEEDSGEVNAISMSAGFMQLGLGYSTPDIAHSLSGIDNASSFGILLATGVAGEKFTIDFGQLMSSTDYAQDIIFKRGAEASIAVTALTAGDAQVVEFQVEFTTGLYAPGDLLTWSYNGTSIQFAAGGNLPTQVDEPTVNCKD